MRWFWRLLAGLAVLLAALGGGGYLYLRTSLPSLDGGFVLSGLEAPVEVVRDRHGVPHIHAQSRRDALFALGFVHAQDRLWQMETMRRAGAGRLAEMLGERALPTDRLMRGLGLYRLSEGIYRALDAESRALLDAYVLGVNAQLTESGQTLPPEFLLLRHSPEPWRAADSLVWLKLMALDLATNWRHELFRLRLSQRLSPRQLREFYPDYGPEEPVGPLAGMPTAPADNRRAALPWPLADGPQEGVGSNQWVVSGAHSATGAPLLANDPHLRLRTPSIWYLAHISWGERHVIGATLPGLPAIVIGRNERIAWGLANTYSDVQDIYIERGAAAAPDSYLTPQGPRPFEVREETIAVGHGADRRLRFRRTRHGPVLNDMLDELDGLTRPGDVLALAWTALAPADSTFRALLRLNVARDWQEFVAAASEAQDPQQNIVYADVDGNIGFLAPGRVPVRAPGNESRGVMPVPGWLAENDWIGFIPFSALPRQLNPPRGMLLSANHKIVGEEYPYRLGSDWAHGYRAARIGELLRARGKHSLESFKALQLDTVSPQAHELLPLLLRAAPHSPLGREAHALLSAWDGTMAVSGPEPLIYTAWSRELERLIYADELGPLFASAWGGKARFLRFVLGGDGDAWCDDIATERREDCAHAVTRALERAVSWLAERHGDDPRHWRWGAAHKARGQHLPFGDIPLLGRLFETRVESPGGSHTINVGVPAIADPEAPFTNIHGPGLRAIFDLDDLDRSLYIQSTGQSGNPLSPRYRSFVERWADGGYVPMSTRPEQIAVGALGRLRLEPPE